MSDQPHFPSELGDAPYPSARGILDCLRMLTDEAAALRLAGTVDALRAAIAACAAETMGATETTTGPEATGADAAPVIAPAPRGTRLH